MRPTVDPRDLPERNFQNQVISWMQMTGWSLIYHAPNGGKAGRVDRAQRGAGFPDIVAVHERDRRLLFAELKTNDGRLRPAQMLWIAALTALGGLVEVYVWRPDDWDELVEILQHPPKDEQGSA